MSVRTKAGLTSVTTSLVCFVAFAFLFPIGRAAIWGFAWVAALLVTANVSELLIVRLFRCPHCGARFGYHSFVRYGAAGGWPWRDCWNCCEDLGETSN